MRHRSVGALLTRAFGVLVGLIVCAGVTGLAAALVQHRLAGDLGGHVQPLELANADLRAVLSDAQRSLTGYLLTGDERLLDGYDLARSRYPQAVQTMQELATGGEDAGVREQAARADSWWAQADSRRGRPSGASPGLDLFQAFDAANADFGADLAVRAATLQRRGSLIGGGAEVTLLSLTVLAAVLAALTAVRTTRRITGPLAQLAAENDRARDAELELTRLRGAVRTLGYRIRGHLVVADAQREAVRGLAGTLGADHVLLRMADGQTDVPPLTSLNDEHAGGPLSDLAACPVTWLGHGDVWAGDDPPPALDAPEAERRAWAAVGDGPVLTVAVSDGDRCLGALTLFRDRGPAWSPVEVRLAEVVAADLGRGVHHARLYERERHLVARLQELDTAKTDFMSTVSHELRTPLTSIAGYLELLLDAEGGELADPQRRMLEVIGRNTRRLRELIEDMLILSRIESGGFRTNRRPTDLALLVVNALTAIEPAATKASIGLHCALSGPLLLPADPEQLDRVLTNLLSNAVKFTPADGTVTVTGRRDGDHVVLAVADTGMGIPQAEQPALFARFHRASNAIHQAIPGTGLGLAIVRTIVDNHHGRIAVQSTEGAGTTVTIQLPTDD